MTSTSYRLEVVSETSQPALLERFRQALEDGSAVAVLDPAWPRSARTAARDVLDAAEQSGRITPGDLVLFTSGTTGRPRAVHRSRASWQSSVAPFTTISGVDGDDVVWLPGPLWSSLFLFGAYHALSVGAHILTGDLVPAAAAIRASAVHCVPAQVPSVLAAFGAGRRPAPATLIVAGDRLAEHVRAAVRASGLHLVEYYGTAELSFIGWRDGDGPYRPFPGVQVSIRDGLIHSRSPYHGYGYLDAGASGSGGPLRVTPRGWACVGDLGREVRPGDAGPGSPTAFEVLGRGDQAVTIGGHTVVVEDVEARLRAVPGVVDAAVVGLKHRRLGQSLAAVVVTDLSPHDLRRAVSDLPRSARPRRWVVVDELPRTPSGKVDRARARRFAERS